ncbi:MAG: hypothetical protein PPHEMADMSA_0282 [uncultured Paraburkholderia sp.]|nr:MAG: hypothetical protein PPHEMADMSA_0282 [uncultured Paraburkholderia sp.]
MKMVLALVASIVLLGACAQGGSASGNGSVTMYGTIDEGITFPSNGPTGSWRAAGVTGRQ